VNRRLIVLALLVIIGGCSFAADRDIRAYNTCVRRHPQDTAVCDGPRQAYEFDGSILQADSAAGAASNRRVP
jgi:hypothetical protein